LLEVDPTALAEVHACLGLPLRADGELLGILTADSLDPMAFDHIADEVLASLAELAAATLKTNLGVELLERRTQVGLTVEAPSRSACIGSSENLIGESRAISSLREDIMLVGPSTMTVLITGETGVGKELVARSVHRHSQRSHRPFVELNCAALPPNIAESELFGHVRGAFTGATRDRIGKLELANGATLFLDEIGELPPELQPKLLRALQQGDLQRVGADRCSRVDVRFIAATNRKLEHLVETGRFREDLYHRLNAFRLDVPPLRERLEDLPLLCGRFCDDVRQRLGLGAVRITRDAYRALLQRSWPGNVRELENCIQRATLRASRGMIAGAAVVVRASDVDDTRSLVAEPHKQHLPSVRPLGDQLDDFRREAVRTALARAGGNQAAAARLLGLHRSNFHHLLRKLELAQPAQDNGKPRSRRAGYTKPSSVPRVASGVSEE
jgi:anaerobic nitric oxide reductase transcription regulator